MIEGVLLHFNNFMFPAIRILGPRTVKKGESFVLACNATGGKSAPNDLDWVKDDRKLVSDKSGRINITKHI